MKLVFSLILHISMICTCWSSCNREPVRAGMQQKCKLKHVKVSKTRTKYKLMRCPGDCVSWFTVHYIFIVWLIFSRIWTSEREKQNNFSRFNMKINWNCLEIRWQVYLLKHWNRFHWKYKRAEYFEKFMKSNSHNFCQKFGHLFSF